MYELVILMFLMRGPMHGYLIASILNDIIGPYAKISHGRLYPLLTQLETRGLITAAEHGRTEKPHDRRQRAYQITAAGQERFHELMLDTTSNLGDYLALFWMKIQVLELLSLSERIYVIDHYLTYCQTHVYYLTSQMERLERDAAQQQFMSPDQLAATLYAMERYRRQWRLEIELVTAWRQREAQRAEGEQIEETSHNAVPAAE